MYSFARNTRIAISIGLATVAFFAAATATTGIAVNAGWICRIQIVNLILSGSLPLIAGWGILTFIFGRVYCSSVCPLGTLQDIASHICKRSFRHSGSYHYRRPAAKFRITTLLLMAAGMIIGNSLIVTMLDPFFRFNIIIEGAVMPACTLGAASVGAAIAIEAIITFIVVIWISGRYGRLLCNTICPVGNALALVSSHAIFRMDINTDTCTGCLKCVEVCKASCINPTDHTIDSGRCIMCLNCAAQCPNKAITYTCNRHRLQKPLMAT